MTFSVVVLGVVVGVLALRPWNWAAGKRSRSSWMPGALTDAVNAMLHLKLLAVRGKCDVLDYRLTLP
jgi:hypothetical protein